MKKYLFFTTFFLFVDIFNVAHAKFTDIKTISQLRIENLNDKNYQSTDSQDEFLNSSIRTNLASKFIFNQKWFLSSSLRLEQLSAPNYSDRNYNNLGLYLRDFRVGYNDRNFTFFAGKFRPFFGITWHNSRSNWNKYDDNNQERLDYGNIRGIWTDFVASNYGQVEKLGGGAIVKSGNASTTGKYELGVSFFTNDRKNFDNTIFASRVSATKSDALPGDTRSLKSYVTSLDISFDFAKDEKLFYRFAYINLAVNSLATQGSSTVSTGKIADQKGYNAAMNYQYPFSPNFNLNGLIEHVYMKNVGGNSDISDNYLNGSLIANIYNNWNITFGYGNRKNLYTNQNGFDQNMIEFSGGYRFDQCKIFDSLLLQIGHRNLETGYKGAINKQNNVAFLMRYIKNF